MLSYYKNANNQSAHKEEPQDFQKKVEVYRPHSYVQYDPESSFILPGAFQARCMREGYYKDSKEAELSYPQDRSCPSY